MHLILTETKKKEINSIDLRISIEINVFYLTGFDDFHHGLNGSQTEW